MIIETSDEISLLNAIVDHRDREAFSVIFDRYHEHSYNLAFRILGNSALAEDAVQEAMLKIWLATKPPQSSEDVRVWIMGIVTNQSLNLGRSHKRRTMSEKRTQLERNIPNETTNEVERKELMAVMKNHIQQLPEAEAQLLSCCYGASLSHRKSGKLLGVPQRTVTDRIQQALNRLRTNLSKSGAAAVVPLLSAVTILKWPWYLLTVKPDLKCMRGTEK